MPPDGAGPWRLEAAAAGTLEGLTLAPSPEAAAPLGAGQVRVAVRAAGLNFRDVLIALGMYPGQAVMGSEIAGVVRADRARGDGARGRGPGAGPGLRRVRAAGSNRRPAPDVPVPDGWSFARAAAAAPAVAFADRLVRVLVELAGARAGQKLLVHAAAGYGVGMAAVAIAPGT